MALRCPVCRREWSEIPAGAGSVRCGCGEEILLFPVSFDREDQDEIARGADRIVNLILHSDVSDVDLEIAIERLRERAEELFPGRGWLFEMIYAARFRRIKEQWR